MKSRLRKNQQLFVHSNFIQILHSFMLNSGDIIKLNVKLISNRPWYQITHNHEYHTSSYYDGDNFDEACNFYEELLLAFRNLSEAEKFKKHKDSYVTQINNLFERKNKQYNDTMLKKKTLFLGINDF